MVAIAALAGQRKLNPGTMPNEIELKLRIASADVPHLRHHPAILASLSEKPVTRKLTSIYYDTPQLALLDAGISLRVRRMSGGWFQAVKAAGHSLSGLHQRMEWEDIIAFGHPDFSKITAPELTKIFDDRVLRAALAPIFSTVVHRTEWQLAWENGDRIELALDLGNLVIGDPSSTGKSERISEIELELKGGNTGRLFELARELQQDIPLTLENISKAQRGYAHYRPQAPVVLKAQRTRLKHNMSGHDAFSQIVWECLSQMQGNQDMVLNGTDPEGVHQMRVALRRLRSAFSVFRILIDQQSCAPLQSDIRWISEVLGTARDLDVFITETLPPLRQHLHAHPGLQQLREKAESARLQAYAEVRTALASQHYQRLQLTLADWLVNNRWHGADAPETSALDIAHRMLAKRYKQLQRHGECLREMRPEERHAARIAAKRLRYAAEFFDSLYPDAKTTDFLRALAALQDILGELNDIAVTEHLILTLTGNRPGKALDATLHLFAGWNASNAMHRLASMEKAWRRFARQKPFWE